MNELIGKGRPFYSALDMGAKALKRKVGTGSEFLKELMALPGVKPTELKERGLESLMNEPKMTHEQFLSHLSQKSNPRIIDKTLTPVTDSEIIDDLIYQEAREEAEYLMGRRGRRNSDEYDETVDNIAQDLANNQWNRFSQIADRMRQNGEIERGAAHEQWTLPGGDNYREMLIKYPMGNFEGVPSHFNGEPNILASMRLMDRKGPNGEKLLHLEELQSDWHQKGRENGYTNGLNPEEKDELTKLKRLPLDEVMGNPQLHERFSLLAQKKKGVPEAPFKKNWEEMAIKRLIHHAAEKGYHGIVMTPGKEQADRYSLAKHIDSLSYEKKGDKYHLRYVPHGGGEFRPLASDLTPEDLESHVGKEMAQKIVNKEGNRAGSTGIYTFPNVDLQVGGEGMKGFYDKKVPNIFNQIGKKHGVQMQLHGHEENLPRVNYFGDDPVEARTTQLHHFPITEPMRQDILTNGLPLYNTGGVVHKAEGGNVQPSILQMRDALQRNKYTLPKSDIQSIGANEAPDLSPKYYVQPGRDGNPSVGGVDMDKVTPGMQLVAQQVPNMQPPGSPNNPQGGQQPQSPLGAPPSPQGGQPSNILSLTPQGQAMSAMTPQPQPQGLAGGGQPKGYLKSTPTKPHPLVGKRHKATPQGNLAQRIAFDIFSHEGKGSILPVPYDATSRDNLVTHISGHKLKKPLLTEAGFDYSMDPNHIAQQIGGASGLQIAGRVQDRINTAGQEHDGNVFLLPNTMGENAEYFSHHPAHILLDLMKQRKLEPHILDAMTHDLRSQYELVEDKNTKKKYKVYPYQNFVGFGHPKMEEQIMRGGHGLETSAGNLRKKLMDRLGGVNMQKLLDYNLADLKGGILDPDLATDPKGYMGRTVVKAQPGAPLRLSKHGSYDTDYAGEYQGSMQNRPIELLMPDVYSNIHTELTGMKKNEGKSDPQMRAQVVGAIEKRKSGIAQPINARVINNAGLYEQGLKQGEFDPKDLDSVLAYYKRKGGFKKGGKVKDNLDNMRYSLTMKSKKAK